MSNIQNVLKFKNRINEITNNLIKDSDSSIFLKILFNKTIENINRNIDINNRQYKKSKYKSSNLLKKTGRLINSIKITNNEIKISGNKQDIIKRNVHNFGATIKSKNKKYLLFKVSNNKFYKVKQVIIPKREFFPNKNCLITQESFLMFKSKILNSWKR